MQEKWVVLATTTFQGIGLQIAKELGIRGIALLVGSRNLERYHA